MATWLLLLTFTSPGYESIPRKSETALFIISLENKTSSLIERDPVDSNMPLYEGRISFQTQSKWNVTANGTWTTQKAQMQS